MHARKMVIAALAVSFSSSCFADVSPLDCRVEDHHFTKPTPTDLGQGVVSTQSYPRAFSSGSFRFEAREIVNCEDGRKLQIVYVDDNEPGKPGGYYAGAAATEFEKSINEGFHRSFDQFREVAKFLELPIRETVLEREDCGCAAFYPSLQGTKEAAFVPMEEVRRRALEPKPDTTRRSYPIPQFILRLGQTTAHSNEIASVYTPPVRLGETDIVGYGYRDFKSCPSGEAVRVHYSSGASGEINIIYGGRSAMAFERSLENMVEISIESISAIAKKHGLRAAGSEYAQSSFECDLVFEAE